MHVLKIALLFCFLFYIKKVPNAIPTSERMTPSARVDDSIAEVIEAVLEGEGLGEPNE